MVDRLEDIGFYTLSDARCAGAGVLPGGKLSPLSRCELILTDKCNFKCPYCRGVKDEYSGVMDWEETKRTLSLWFEHDLKNVRFSGGEPMTYGQQRLVTLGCMCKDAGVEHIAISTNGSFSIEKYEELIHCGFNDFSISLDACCAATGDKMAGGIRGAWAKVVENIAAISKKTYVTVGIVLTDDNVEEMVETVEFAHGLGVADIRIISSAQSNAFLAAAALIPDIVLDAHPILKYRVNNIATGRHVRGLCDGDSSRCGLVIDDIAAVGGYHFPCIIYLREGGKPIGKVGPEMRQERLEWFKKHCSYCDPICKKNCLDVCIDYNNKFRDTHK